MSSSSLKEGKFALVFWTFCCMGVAILMPWNSFTNSSDYWMYKYRDVDEGSQVPWDHKTNGTWTNFNLSSPLLTVVEGNVVPAGQKYNHLQLEWNSYLSIVNFTPKILILYLNALFGHKIKIVQTVVVCTLINVVFFGVSDVLSFINTDNFQDTFFFTTLLAIFTISCSTAVMQGMVPALAARFPEPYMNGFVSFQSVGAIVVSALQTLFLSIGADQVEMAQWVFLFGVVLVVLSLVMFIVSSRTPFFKVFAFGEYKPIDDQEPESQSEEEDNLVNGEDEDDNISTIKIIYKVWPWIATMLMIYLVTLSVFPSISALVESVDKGKGSKWADVYFSPIACFLNYNLSALIGIQLTKVIRLPRNRKGLPLILLGASTSRLIFLPLLLFCNACPNNRILTEVLISSDELFMLIISLLGATGGYLMMTCMSLGPKTMKNPVNQGRVASILMLALILGLMSGALLSQPLILLL